MVMSQQLRRRPVLLVSGTLLLVLIAWADLKLDDALPLALLYIVPVVLLSTMLSRWQVVVLGVACTVAAEVGNTYAWTVRQGIPRDILYLLAYTAAGFYVAEFVRRHRAEQVHLAVLEREMEARRGAEEQLRLVLATSSLAIITSDADGRILDANASAEELFLEGTSARTPLLGLSLHEFIPSLGRVQIRKEGWQQVKTMMQCQGFRSGKEPFLADVWFSSYRTTSGGRMTSMILDSSAEMRDREEGKLEQVLAGSRLAVGALAHEIRNICAAITVVQANLSTNSPHLRGSEDFLALEKLTTTLESMSTVELSRVKRQLTPLQLQTFFRDLYVIVSATVRDADVTLRWEIEEALPPVWAEGQSLLQVVLNLIRNAVTALSGVPNPQVTLRAVRAGTGVEVSVHDNGPGVAQPEQLFNPFRTALGTGGFGLYLSRAMMLSVQGDLRYVPGVVGATFVIVMIATEAQ